MIVSAYLAALLSASTPTPEASTSSTTTSDAQKPASRTEWGGLPALNYNSDFGLGLGAIVNVARIEPGYNPYRWLGYFQAFLTLQAEAGENVQVPIQSHQARFDLPGLWGGKLRLGIGLSFFEQANAGWFGVGSRSERREFTQDELSASETARRFHEYRRVVPSLRGSGRLIVWEEPVAVGKRRLEVFVSGSLSYNETELYAGSLLAQQAARLNDGSADARVLSGFLKGLDDHGLLTLDVGVIWDSRSSEFATRRGWYAEASLRGSPGVDQGLRYAGVNTDIRGFFTLGAPWLVTATRIELDALMGNAPYYALTDFGGLDAMSGVGGETSLRGLLQRRFGGRIKGVASVEMRAYLPPFALGSQHFTAMAVGFSDVGQVRADVSPLRIDNERLDAPGLDLQASLGGGVRLLWGETFVIRAEYAAAVTDGTQRFYLTVGEPF